MANDLSIQLLGKKELENVLESLPPKLQRKFMLATWRRSSKPMIVAARSNIKGYSQTLAKSIGNITGRSRKYPTIYVGPRAKGNHKGWFGNFVEFGVSGLKRNRKQGSKRESDNPVFAKMYSNVKPGARYRKDQKSRPFMRPAINSTKNKVGNNFYKETKVVLQKQVDKYNKYKGLT